MFRHDHNRYPKSADTNSSGTIQPLHSRCRPLYPDSRRQRHGCRQDHHGMYLQHCTIDQYLAPGSTFQNNPASLYDNLQTQAGPGATVVILPYITFYNDQVSHGRGCWVLQATRQRMNQQVINVNAALRAAADAPAFQFLDETDLQNSFNGHRFCDSETKWIQGNVFESLNPTA